MQAIPCPWCGKRAESEFRYGGESHVERPGLAADDGRWADYLYFRANTKGVQRERWQHQRGCGLWFNLVRDTATHAIHATYGMTDAQASLPEMG